METTITAAELAKNLPDVLSRVHDRGEQFVIERDGHPIATLAPTDPARTFTFADLIKLLAELPPPDEDFARDLEEIRKSVPPPEMPKRPD